jgi:hypothetical protein
VIGLLPQVVLRTDPRWTACVEELRRLVASPDPQLVGLDTEFFESAELRAFAEASGRDMPKKDAWDSWSTQLRLLQVGLPSGLAMVFDFGPRGFSWAFSDDQAQGPSGELNPYAQPRFVADVDREALALVGQLCASRIHGKCGWSLSTEALILRRHFGWLLRKPRDGMLASQVLWAGVAHKKRRFTAGGVVDQVPLSHGFKYAAERVGVALDKEQQTSDFGAEELTVEQMNYAALDVSREKLLEVWRRLSVLAKREDVWQSVIYECDSSPAFYECEWRGTPLDFDSAIKVGCAYKRVGDQCFESVKQILGHPGEGEGSRNQLAVGLTQWLRDHGHPHASLYRWERGKDDAKEVIPEGPSLSVEAAQPLKLPKPRKPTKKDLASDPGALAAYERVLSGWELAVSAPKWRLMPEMGEAALAQYDDAEPVIALLEGRSCRSTEGKVEKRIRNSWDAGDGRLATRCRYWQIAGSFDSGSSEASGAGAGMGRSSASKPINNQNETTCPLGTARHKELDLANARVPIRPGAGRAMIVGDFSQAHMRFAAEVSQDPALCDDFRAGRDAHIRLAANFAQNEGADRYSEIELKANTDLDEESRTLWRTLLSLSSQERLSEVLTGDYPAHVKRRAEQIHKAAVMRAATFESWCEAYQVGKKHPLYALIKENRQPAKTGNYTCLNMGSPEKLARAAETAPEPLHLPMEKWELIRARWREVYSVLYQFQRYTIKNSDRACATFPFVEGEYGVVWNAARDRKLYLIKEWNVPAWADGSDDGRYSVKGTDAVSAVWMMSEANALKIALAIVQADFDACPEWEAFIFNVVHDEIDAECAEAHKHAVAKCVFDAMQEGLRRAGLKSIPTCASEDAPDKLIVSCWADK